MVSECDALYARESAQRINGTAGEEPSRALLLAGKVRVLYLGL